MIKACCAFWLHNTKDINQHNKYVYNFLDVSVFSFRCPFNPLLWLLALGGLSRSRIVCIVSFQSHQLVSFSILILLKLSSWCDKMSNHLGLRSEFVWVKSNYNWILFIQDHAFANWRRGKKRPVAFYVWLVEFMGNFKNLKCCLSS